MKTNLGLLQKAEVERKLVQGAVDRAATLSYFFSIVFVAYGVSSLTFIKKFSPEITLWNNVWPRFVLNSVPFLLIAMFFKNYKKNPFLKMWLWVFAFPLLFATACMINVWPIMFNGHPELYLYVHAANFFVILTAMILVSPPPIFLAFSCLALALGVIGPLIYIFLHQNDSFLLGFMLNDMAPTFLFGSLASYHNYKLRRKLAIEDVLNKHKVQKFIGNAVAESIFENNEGLLKPRKAFGFVMAIDVRGFTSFIRNGDASQSSLLMERYHRAVAKTIFEHGGFIHKTNGDGHLITFGIMNDEIDLSDLVGIESEDKLAKNRKNSHILANALNSFEKIQSYFERLKEDLGVDHDLCVCASVDFGEITLRIIGDPNTRMEFDLDGLVVIRATRLEGYTKTLREITSKQCAFLIVSQEAAEYLLPEFRLHALSTESHPVRDFPEQKVIFYKEFQQKRKIKQYAA